jgi:SAM-dependent methyltransferase
MMTPDLERGMDDKRSAFGDLPLPEIYAGLLSGRFGPKWPNEAMQRGYVGTYGVDLLRRAFKFTDILEQDGAFANPDWRGLDYGCGWGRFASVLLAKGSAQQLDLCDAWAATLQILGKLNYENRVFKVPELLGAGDLPSREYDFVLSFSVFTHLNDEAFHRNIPVILESLKRGGQFYFTVRHEEFIAHKYSDRANDLSGTLSKDGFVHVDSGGSKTPEKVFGDMIVLPSYLEQFGRVRYLGQPHSLQHVYAIGRE